MAKSRKKSKTISRVSKTAEKKSASLAKRRPQCLQIAKQGIQTGGDFALMMSALMSDVVEGKIAPQVANATTNAGGKLLKVVEMTQKYGIPISGSPQKILRLLPFTE